MIHAEGLTRKFDNVTAVDGLDLDVEDGEVFGLLGPNGAGKTTTVRMLASLISKSAGRAVVAGCELGNPAEELRLRSRIGVLPENVGLYEGNTAYQNLDYFGRLYRLDATARRQNIEKLLRMLDLWEKRDVPLATFSKGMKQKVALARTLVHDPVLLFLDEPTANLDPEATKIVRDFILELKREKRTIFLNTHNLDEAQQVCDRVGIMRTTLLRVGSPRELEGRLRGRQTQVRLGSVSPALIQTLRTRLAPRRLDVDGDRLRIEVDDPERENPAITRAVLEAGGTIVEITSLAPTLEEVYLALVRAEGSTP